MKKLLIIVFAILPLCLSAQRRSHDTYTPAPDEQPSASDSGYEYDSPSTSNKDKKDKEHKKVFTGFSGGMMIHGGYSFASSPAEMFRNGSLTENGSSLTDLPKDGFTMGLGGTLRLHLIDHIHLGGEGHMSYMPLTKSGTSIRTGWGGVMCDFYATLGIVRPLIGLCVGGGSTRRIYVPDETGYSVKGEDEVEYNASFTKTPFFLFDPYVGLEIALGKISLLIRADYMLPFGKSENGLANTKFKDETFLRPSGPRLYIGCLFGH